MTIFWRKNHSKCSKSATDEGVEYRNKVLALCYFSPLLLHDKNIFKLSSGCRIGNSDAMSCPFPNRELWVWSWTTAWTSAVTAASTVITATASAVATTCPSVASTRGRTTTGEATSSARWWCRATGGSPACWGESEGGVVVRLESLLSCIFHTTREMNVDRPSFNISWAEFCACHTKWALGHFKGFLKWRASLIISFASILVPSCVMHASKFGPC